MVNLNNLLKDCTLCPRKCHINRYIKKGVCGANNNLKIAHADLYYYEEPVISSINGSGTIFFSNCNLKCVFCQNKKISINGYGKEISIDKFSEICIELQNKNAHNINLVTPTMYVPHIINGIELAKKKGLNIPIVYNTSGYETTDTIKLLKNTVDIYLTDFKYFDNKYGVMYSNIENYFEYASSSLEEMYKQVGPFVIDENNIMKKGIIVRILILPDNIEDSKKIINYLYSKYRDNIIFSIMNQYTPVTKQEKYINLNRTITEEEYNEVINYACDLGIKNAFIQDGNTQSESFIPNFNMTDI